MLKMELKRAFRSRTFYVAMVIGLVIALGQYLENVAPMVKYLDMDLKKMYILTPFSINGLEASIIPCGQCCFTLFYQ